MHSHCLGKLALEVLSPRQGELIFCVNSLLEVHMKQNLFLRSYKIIRRLKCKIPKFEMSRVKLDDFPSAESWPVLTRAMVVQNAQSKYHVTTFPDAMLATTWLEEEDITSLAPLRMKVVKTVGKQRELNCTS